MRNWQQLVTVSGKRKSWDLSLQTLAVCHKPLQWWQYLAITWLLPIWVKAAFYYIICYKNVLFPSTCSMLTRKSGAISLRISDLVSCESVMRSVRHFVGVSHNSYPTFTPSKLVVKNLKWGFCSFLLGPLSRHLNFLSPSWPSLY